MERTRIEARDAALHLLNRLTLGFAAAAVAGVGVFAAISAATIPGSASAGTQASTQTSTTTGSDSSSSTDSSDSGDSGSSNSVQPSSSPVGSATSGSGMVATGASH